MENIQVYGGYDAVRLITQVNQTSINDFYANRCKFSYAQGKEGNGFTLKGGNSYLVNCIASKNFRDGFNYHKNLNINTNCIEINCIGRSNGYEEYGHINNGSTQHDGGKIIRINGKYYENQGGNIADTSSKTQSFNVNCEAYDSRSAIIDYNFNLNYYAYNSNFTAHSGSTFWLIDSISDGKSKVDVRIEKNAKMYVRNNNFKIGMVCRIGELLPY
jgi:hypothetical protein